MVTARRLGISAPIHNRPADMPVATEDSKDDGTVERPVNREPPVEELCSSFITNHNNYDRNHGPLAHLSADGYTVLIDGLVSTRLDLSIDALAHDFPQHSVTCALQCAGNRRHSMRTRIKEVQGIDWLDGAIMNCRWDGPKLQDILLRAGVGYDKKEDSSGRKEYHVQFASHSQKTPEEDWYGGSIPLDRALAEDKDVILAVKMNGEPLPERHGFPVRVIVPGVLGARSVKWVDRITVADQESPCYYQRHDYKILPPDATDSESANKYWDKTPAMLDMPINSSVATPVSDSMVSLDANGSIEVKGYAVPHGDQGPVVRVQVSGDEGKSWIDAEIDGGREASKWSWALWKAQIKMQKGKQKKIFTKATDKGGNTQTEERSTWNLRGVAYNGYEAVVGLEVV